MARIKITPEQVRAVATQFRQSSEMSQDMVNKLNTSMRGLEPDWEGMTKERFYMQFQDWQSKMSQFVVLLNDINQQLVVISQRFEQADAQVR